MRLEMLFVVRKDEVIMKKEIVLNAASWMKEWLRSGAPKGPRQRSCALGRVDFQWGRKVWGMG